MTSTDRRAAMRLLAALIVIVTGTMHTPSPAAASVDVNELAICNSRQGNPERRVTACTLILDDLTSDERAKAYVQIGQAYDQLQKPDLAIAAYTQALALSPNLSAALNGRGGAYTKKAQYSEAIADYDAAINLNPKNFGALANRCAARAEQGVDLDRALDDCNASLNLLPSALPVYGQRALVFLRMAKYQNAIADYDKGINAVPRSAYFLFGRGVAKIRLGDKVGGESDIATARTIDAGIGPTFATLGLIP